VIESEKATYAVKRMCELLQVSRSGFYKWRKSTAGGPSPAAQRRAELDAAVAGFHQASDGVYGAPRILADLRAAGAAVSRKTVAASLRRQGLAGICPRRFAPATTIVDLDAPVPKDLVGRRFDTGKLDRVWTSDITYLRTGEGWLYLLVTWNHAGVRLFVPRCHHELRGPVHCVGDLGRKVAGLAASRAGMGVVGDLGRFGAGTSHDRRIRPRPGGVSAGVRAGGHRPGLGDPGPDRVVRQGVADSPEPAWTESCCVGFGFGSGERDAAAATGSGAAVL
jgi:HTH-like domain